LKRDQWLNGKKVQAFDYDEAELKKYGLDTQKMYDSNGNPLSEREAMDIIRKRHAYSKEVAKAMFEKLKLNEKSS
jgi:hypothetical protein